MTVSFTQHLPPGPVTMLWEEWVGWSILHGCRSGTLWEEWSTGGKRIYIEGRKCLQFYFNFGLFYLFNPVKLSWDLVRILYPLLRYSHTQKHSSQSLKCVKATNSFNNIQWDLTHSLFRGKARSELNRIWIIKLIVGCKIIFQIHSNFSGSYSYPWSSPFLFLPFPSRLSPLHLSLPFSSSSSSSFSSSFTFYFTSSSYTFSFTSSTFASTFSFTSTFYVTTSTTFSSTSSSTTTFSSTSSSSSTYYSSPSSSCSSSTSSSSSSSSSFLLLLLLHLFLLLLLLLRFRLPSLKYYPFTFSITSYHRAKLSSLSK